VLYGKGSIFGMAVGLKRHQARCAGKPRSRAGTHSEKATARKTRVAAAAAMPPVKMEGDGVEKEDIDFVDTLKYLGFHFESGGDRWHHVEIWVAMAASARGNHGGRSNLGPGF
jgi:hypothetical protein